MDGFHLRRARHAVAHAGDRAIVARRGIGQHLLDVACRITIVERAEHDAGIEVRLAKRRPQILADEICVRRRLPVARWIAQRAVEARLVLRGDELDVDADLRVGFEKADEILGMRAQRLAIIFHVAAIVVGGDRAGARIRDGCITRLHPHRRRPGVGPEAQLRVHCLGGLNVRDEVLEVSVDREVIEPQIGRGPVRLGVVGDNVVARVVESVAA